MMDVLKSLLDPYDRKARLAPVLLCALPLIVSLLLLVPDFGQIWVVIGGLASYCGTGFLIQVGRDRGKILEPQLYKSWGGKPSVAMLRHADKRINYPTKHRYRVFLECAVPGLKLASAEEERIDPEGADEGYESANSWILAQTRDRSQFYLLFKENVSYGFRRNIWALKPWAFALDSIAILVVITVIIEAWTGNSPTTFFSLGAEMWAILVIIVVHMLFFMSKIRPEWVRLAAEAYAEQLLATCDILRTFGKVPTA